jgi:hypothetical protein
VERQTRDIDEEDWQSDFQGMDSWKIDDWFSRIKSTIKQIPDQTFETTRLHQILVINRFRRGKRQFTETYNKAADRWNCSSVQSI